MNKLFLTLIPLLLLTGCLSINEHVGETFFTDIWARKADDAYVYVGYDEKTGSDIFKVRDGHGAMINHKALLVTPSEGTYKDRRLIKQILNEESFNLLMKQRKELAQSRILQEQKLAEQRKQQQIQQRKKEAAEQERQREIRLAEQERQRQIRLAKQERQRQIRLANQKRAEEERREKILKMQPVICDEMVTALNENEVRAIRLYPLNKEYRVAGIATDINVTFGDAVVSIKSDVDFFNGCSAEITSFDEAETINKGDSIDLFCSSWRETAGNVIFKKCQLFSQMFKN